MKKKVLIGTVLGLGAAACVAACAKSEKCKNHSEHEHQPTAPTQ